MRILLICMFMLLISCDKPDQPVPEPEMPLEMSEMTPAMAYLPPETLPLAISDSAPMSAPPAVRRKSRAKRSTLGVVGSAFRPGVSTATKSKLDLLNKMRTAKMSFVIPVSANIAETLRAELIVTPKELKETIEHTINGLEIKNDIKVTGIISAELKTEDFKVSNITTTQQLLSDTESTVWKWMLTPLHSGKSIVILSIHANIKNKYYETTKHLKTFEKEIIINITQKQHIMKFIDNNWQWLWSIILIPLITILYSKFKSKDYF